MLVVCFTGNEQNDMAEIFVVDRRDAERDRLRENLSSIIDVEGVGELQSGTRRNESVQVEHGTTLFPDECVQEIVAIGRATDNLPPGVDRPATAAGIVSHRSKIQDAAVPP